MPMKIGDKIKLALKMPQVIQRRAQFKAMGYLFTHNPNTVIEIESGTTHGKDITSICLWWKNRKGYKRDYTLIWMTPLSAYNL